MDPLVVQEYTFNIYSARYGHFLVDVYQAYPEVLIAKSGSAIRIRVPEEAATMLKLKYGDSLIVKPKVKKEFDFGYDDEEMWNNFIEEDEDDA